MAYLKIPALTSLTSLITSPSSQAPNVSPSTPGAAPTSTPKLSPLLSHPPDNHRKLLHNLLLSPLPVPLTQKCRFSFGSVEALHPWPIQPNVYWDPKEIYRHPPSTGILFTCRALYTIGFAIYYPQNAFVIRIGCLRRFIDRLPKRVLLEIRSLEVRCEEDFMDWALWPLLCEFRGLERLIIEPPGGRPFRRWNNLNGMVHTPGIAPGYIQRAGLDRSGDVLRGVSCAAVAEVSLEEEAEAQSVMEEAVQERMPKLTGFWIKGRDMLSRFASASRVGEASNWHIEFSVMTAIHDRERNAGGLCTCTHTANEEFCCRDCPLRVWEVDGKYRPSDAPLPWVRNSMDVKPWEQAAFGLSEDGWREGWLEEDVWGVNNTKILRRRYEKLRS